jgi:cobalt-zinc-cadmium efflux system outer membrane protein
VALKVTRDQVPDLVDQRVGLVMTVPLLDRRQGPIAEASVELERSQRALTERSLALERALQSAWQRYELARAEVTGFESGLLQEAEAALRVAEAAYRYGERGILDYLDAQRTVRTVRDELNHARYELRAALIDLERLSAVSE